METKKNMVTLVLNYMEDHIEEEIDVDHIAQSVGYSKFYLNGIFSEYTGTSIYKYLQSRRLTIAAEKLVYTDLAILQIAYEAGYDSQQSFTLAFKQLYAYPPNCYRTMGVFVPRQNRIILGSFFFNSVKEMAA